MKFPKRPLTDSVIADFLARGILCRNEEGHLQYTDQGLAIRRAGREAYLRGETVAVGPSS